MSDFVTLSCPSCGGKLQITHDIDRFACGYCGHEHVVKRSGGVVTIAPMIEGLRRVQIGTDRTAAELAIVRLEKEINELQTNQNRLKSTPFAKLYPPGRLEQFLPWGLLFFLFAMCVGFSGTNLNAAILWGLLAIICLGSWVYLEQKRVAVGKAELARRLAAFERPIRDRQEELARNRQLVRVA